MSVTALTNLAGLASNQSLGQARDNTPTVRTLQSQPTATSVLPVDSFTPSAQIDSAQAAAQDAGLFQVNQLALSSVTAASLFLQSTSPEASQNLIPAPAVQTSTNGISLALPASTITAYVQAPAATSPPVPAAIPNEGITAGEPQTLNATLLWLGLNNADIQDIDLIASSTKNFSPGVYNDLVQQFQARAAERSAPVAGSTSAAATKVRTP